MFQSVYYSYKNRKAFIRDDELGWNEVDYKPIYFNRVKTQTSNSYPILTGGFAEPTYKFDKENPNQLEKDIHPELRILRDNYYSIEEGTVPKFQNICYFDIEIEMLGALTHEYIKSSIAKITSIALLDVSTKSKYCLILDNEKLLVELKEENKDYKINIIPCNSERELLLKFIEIFKSLDITILCGYNSSYFDLPYLYFRISKILGNSKINELSPLGEVIHNDYNPDNPIKIAGINHLDFMLLLKSFQMKQEDSYKLGDVGIKYVELGKIEYEGNLDSLFKEDINKFIEYNLRDVEIIEALENKLKYIDLTILQCSICNVPYENVFFNTVLNEGALLKELKQLKIISPNKPTTSNSYLKSLKESYAGGYLKDPTPGLYGWLCDLDFTGLYPSILKGLNISIETLVAKIQTKDNYEQNMSLFDLKLKNPEEVLEVQFLNKEEYTIDNKNIKVKNLISIIEDNNFSISCSGGIFDTSKESYVSKILNRWGERRKYFNNLKKKAGKEKNWDLFKFYHARQHSFKILSNGFYGTFALNSFRYTDGYKIISSSITNSGQMLTKTSIDFTNSLINEMLKTKNVDYIIASDTDSLFISLEPILKTKYNNIFKDGLGDKNEIKKITYKISQELQSETNKNLIKICREKFNLKENKYFELKSEYILEKAIWTGKRRYAQYMVMQEGIDIEELDLKGLEILKSNMNKEFRIFGKQVIKDILFGKHNKDLNKEIEEYYKDFKTWPLKRVGKPTGLNKYKEYIKQDSTPGRIFSELHLKCPYNTKSAIYYNDLLKFKEYDKSFPSILVGDRIFCINLKPNEYKINSIALPNDKIPKEIEDWVFKNVDYEGIFDSLLGNKLEELFKDIKWSYPNLKINNNILNKFFKFK